MLFLCPYVGWLYCYIQYYTNLILFPSFTQLHSQRGGLGFVNAHVSFKEIIQGLFYHQKYFFPYSSPACLSYRHNSQGIPKEQKVRCLLKIWKQMVRRKEIGAVWRIIGMQSRKAYVRITRDPSDDDLTTIWYQGLPNQNGDVYSLNQSIPSIIVTFSSPFAWPII